MAATEDSFELTSAEQNRLETAIQTVGDRRNGSLPVAIIAERANLSKGKVRKALNQAEKSELPISKQCEERWVIDI